MCYEKLKGETARLLRISFVHTDFDKEDPVNKKLTIADGRDGCGWTNGASRCSTALSVESGFAANHSGRMANHGGNDDGPGCFHEQKPPAEPVHLYGKTLQPHPYKRDDGAPGHAPGPAGDSDCCSVVGGVGTLNSPIRHIRSGRWKTHDAPANSKNTFGMAPGAFNTASYKLDGSTLTITSERNAGGEVANPTTWKLTRIE